MEITETAIDLQYNKDFSVVQANELVRAKKDDLTLLEAKLIYLVIAQICMNDTDLRTYTCSASSLAEFLGIDKDNAYRDILKFYVGSKDKPGTGLKGKSIYFIDKSRPKRRNGEYNYKIIPWVDYFEYIDGIITIRLSDKLKPHLTGLHGYLTKYGYGCLCNLPTYKSMSLFNLLASYESLVTNQKYCNLSSSNYFPHISRSNNELLFTIDYLKDYFNCADRYPNNSDFIKWVIDPSIAAINKETNYFLVSYRTAKEGRKIGYVLFKINAWEDEDFKNFIRKMFPPKE